MPRLFQPVIRLRLFGRCGVLGVHETIDTIRHAADGPNCRSPDGVGLHSPPAVTALLILGEGRRIIAVPMRTAEALCIDIGKNWV